MPSGNTEAALRRSKKDLSRVEPRFHSPEDLASVKKAFLSRLNAFVAGSTARDNPKVRAAWQPCMLDFDMGKAGTRVGLVSYC